MEWFLACTRPKVAVRFTQFPVVVGRGEGMLSNFVSIDDPTVSRKQFSLVQRSGAVFYMNESQTNPAEVDGVLATTAVQLAPDAAHIIRVGDVVIGVGTNYGELCATMEQMAVDYYCVRVNGQELGPWTVEQLVEACNNGVVGRHTRIWRTSDPNTVYEAQELIDFGPEPEETVIASQTEKKRTVYDDEAEAILGETFKCPYCRAVTDLADVLSVSVSPGLMGDPVLGEGEQARFLPSQFTTNGLAVDSEGGICTEIACPHCHMSLPRNLLETPQTVMSVVGAAGAGKSVFLASCIWQCRQLLGRLFGVTFMDLDPVANRWINAYEEKLFFQEDDTTLQQIEKTDLQASNVTRSVFLDGDNVLLPLPSFFQIKTREGAPQSLVVYDSAGEHFRAGADTQSSAVTLNMLSADVLFFMYDPSADPRFRSMLDRGTGTARNYAQRQDVLLAEMSARIMRHLGNRGETRLTRPLIVGISKADLLQQHLPLDLPVYRHMEDGRYALDVGVLTELSQKTEDLLNCIVPEVVATARNIADQVWFFPISALGHNPMREGVRPCDIKPVWTELPVVFTLARKGLIPVVGGEI